MKESNDVTMVATWVSKEFETREHALNWIIENQLGRRNLNPNQIAYLRGKRYETEKKMVSNEKGVNQYSKEVDSTIRNQPDSNTVEKPLTRDRVAKEYTVWRCRLVKIFKARRVSIVFRGF